MRKTQIVHEEAIKPKIDVNINSGIEGFAKKQED